jgi:hypothetical protein
MYLPMLVSPTSMPSMSNSPWIRPRGNPQKRILAARFSDQFSHVFRDRRPSRLPVTNLPRPEQPESSSAPGDQRRSVSAAPPGDAGRRVGAVARGSPNGVWHGI